MRAGWPRCGRRAQRAWLRWLWVATLFSVLQSLFGAVALSALSDVAMVEVCTAQGMHWVTQAEAEQAGPASPGAERGLAARGMAQPCAWALAHVSLPPALPVLRRLPPPPRAQGGPPRAESTPRRLPAAAERILLMAPMRAPPPPAA